MRGMTRDIIVGIMAGLVAVAVSSLRTERMQIPRGVYQTTLDDKKYREMAAMFRAPVGSAETLKKLRTRVDAPDVQGAAFDQVLAYLSDVAGIQIEVEWGVLGPAGVYRNARVNVRLRNVTVGDALRQTIASAAEETHVKLDFQIDGGRIRVSTRTSLSEHVVTRIYEVRGIIAGMLSVDRSLLPPRRGPAMAMPGPVRKPEGLISGEPWTDFVTHPREAVMHLIRTAMENVDPPSWRYTGGSTGQIQYFAGRLIVTQTLPNHDQLALLLQWMREEVVDEPKPQ